MDVGQQVQLLLVHRVKTETRFDQKLFTDPQGALDETLANNGLELPDDQRDDVIEWAGVRAVDYVTDEATKRVVQRLLFDSFFSAMYTEDRDNALDTIIAQFQ